MNIYTIDGAWHIFRNGVPIRACLDEEAVAIIWGEDEIMERLLADDWERLRVQQDGDQYMVVLDDFVDLQESPAVFIPVNSWQGEIIQEWWNATPLIHLPIIEIARIMRELESKRYSCGGRCDTSSGKAKGVSE